jgi:hypothetical protein
VGHGGAATGDQKVVGVCRYVRRVVTYAASAARRGA